MILLFGIAMLSVAFAIFWFVWPDPDAADDLPALGDSIDRAIALAAALPGDDVFTTKRMTPSHVADLWAGYGELAYASPEERVYLTPQGAAVAAAL